jgi:hypothetical protein
MPPLSSLSFPLKGCSLLPELSAFFLKLLIPFNYEATYNRGVKPS